MNGRVILYADKITDSMKRAMGETDRRRKTQLEYNAANGVTPQTIEKEIRRGIEDIIRSRKTAAEAVGMSDKEFNRNEAVAEVEKEMYLAAEKLEFERAAQLRDALRQLTGDMTPAPQGSRKGKRPELKITYKVSDKKHGMPKGFNK